MRTQINRSVVAKTGNLGEHRLIQDTIPLILTRKPTMVTESIDGNKRQVLRMGGRFQFGGKPNANNRIYDTPILRTAVGEIQEDIEGRRVLGELDHPADAKIHLDRVSHLVTKLYMEGDEVFGEIEILGGTPMGDILKALTNNGVTIGISSRGVGDMDTVTESGQEFLEVLPGYTFVTFDVVAEPSVEGSYLNVMESRDRFMKKHYTKGASEKALLKEFKNYLANRV